MSLSAVSVAALIGLMGSGEFQQSVGNSVLSKVRSSVAVLYSDGRPVGSAALIDSRGYFIAHRSTLPTTPIITAKMGEGQLLALVLRSIDQTTQLVLLEAQGWNAATYGARPVEISDGKGLDGKTLVASIGESWVLGQFIAGDRIGIMQPTQRYAPLSEVRFEQPNERIGGGLLFSDNGKFIGVLSATVTPVAAVSQKKEGVGSQRANHAELSYGPRGLTVGYAIGTEVLARVVEGFRSPDRKVLHPTIGAFFKEAESGGALIVSVSPNSPAEQAGLRAGDVVVSVDDGPVKDHLDLALALFRQKIGATIRLGIRREGKSYKLNLTVAGKDQS
jgi:putative serine protease PepD